MVVDRATLARPPDRLGDALLGTRSATAARVSTAVVTSVWLLLLVSVQPWSRASIGSSGQSSNASKGVLVAGCLLLAIVCARGAIRGRVPALWWYLLVYAGLAVASTMLIGGTLSVGTRVVRLLIFLVIPLCLWSHLRDSRTRIITAMFLSYLVFGVTTILGPVLLPDRAWQNGTPFSAGGRLVGPLLPMLPTRIGEIGAVLAGFAVLHWAFRRVRPLPAGTVALLGLALLVLSRTRTATGALGLGLLIAAVATLRSDGGRRLRRCLVWAIVAALPAVPLILAWVKRGQSTDQLSSLTGRTVAWNYIIHLPVDTTTLLLGRGLGHTSVFIRRPDNTLSLAPIDSSWITLYYESGLIGLGLVAAAFLTTLVMAFRARTPFVRACCVFLMTYLAIDGASETGLSDASPLLLMLMVVALASYADRRRPAAVSGGVAPCRSRFPNPARERQSSASHAGSGRTKPVKRRVAPGRSVAS
ncbi:hypothetical protein SAMN05443575_4161 [Jatrophihabitans endophyticus]|uniref:O-antigen ligase n=1 Tax=Jatrophihabitans endophyticus TaxID=1206085 RepID=A0A1M5U7X1_9ACTN|nr:hypothetical protein [Jatrophihabitans endophyticus]SHH59010.1 hypothetical protein SAMN05443575_4161 [Jatrophihabitans endophyticus]